MQMVVQGVMLDKQVEVVQEEQGLHLVVEVVLLATYLQDLESD
jgi:hypothetical protein